MVSARKTAFPDASTLIALSLEMTTSIKDIQESHQLFVTKPAERPLSAQFMRVALTARILSLRSLRILGEETSELAKRIETDAIANDKNAQDAIAGSLAAMTRYVASASAGKVNSGLSLYSAYADVMALLSDRKALNREQMFLPVDPLYGDNASSYKEKKFVDEVKRYYPEFARDFAKFKTERGVEQINAMRTTLTTMEAKNPPASFRLFFSSAIGFLDVASREQNILSAVEDTLLRDIDETLAGVKTGQLKVGDATISWLLYMIAGAKQYTARIRNYQETYDLVRLFEENSSGTVNEQTIANAQQSLERVQKAWESALSSNGDIGVAKTNAFALVSVANVLGDYAIKTMAMAIGSLADGVATQTVAKNQEVAVFGASILLAIGDRISQVTNDPRGGRAMADLHRDRVRALLAGRNPKEITIELPTIGAHSHAIVDEIINQISAAEQIVDQCLRDGAKESKVNEALKLFNMASSAMMLLNLKAGYEYAQLVSKDVKEQLTQILQGVEIDKDRTFKMAEAVMLLGRYVRLVLIDTAQAQNCIEKVREIYAPKDDEVLPPSVIPETSELEKNLPFDECTDEELGPIFLEEANSVLADIIRPGLVRLEANSKDLDALLEVRRGFHTLKGSAAMVDLKNLSAIGMNAEFTLNLVRDNQAFKINELMLNWLKNIATEFEVSVKKLEAGQPAHVNVEAAAAAYKAFSNFETLEAETSVAEDQVPAIQETVEAPMDAFALEAIAAEEIPQIEESVAETPPTLETTNSEISASEVALAFEETIPDLPESLLDSSFSPTSTVQIPTAVESTVAGDQIPGISETLLDSQADVEVGEVVLAGTIYNIFITDAKKYSDTLGNMVLDLINGKKDVVEFELVRMAHSLAGMGRTCGFGAITDLSYQFENWASLLKDQHVAINDVQEQTLRDALEALDAMIAGVSDKLEPMTDESVLTRMRQLVEDAEHFMANGSSNYLADANAETLAFNESVGSEQVALDSSSMETGDLTSLATNSTDAEIPMPDIHVIGDSVDASLINESVAKAIDLVTLPDEELRSDDLPEFDDMPAVPLSEQIEVNAEQAASLADADEVADLQDVPPTIIESSFSTIEASSQVNEEEAIFVVPEVGATVSADQAIPESTRDAIGQSGPLMSDVMDANTGKVVQESHENTTQQNNTDSNTWLKLIHGKTDDLDEEMMEIFHEEADGSLTEIDKSLVALGQDISDKKAYQNLKRAMHTLKGSSNTSGARKIGALFHYLEDIMSESSTVTQELVDRVQSGVDAAFAGIEALRHGKSIESAIIKASSRGVVQNVRHDEADRDGKHTSPETVSQSSSMQSTVIETAADSVTAKSPEQSGSQPVLTSSTSSSSNANVNRKLARSERKVVRHEEDDGSVLRVPSRTVEHMVKTIGEVGITRSRLQADVDLSKISMSGLNVSLDRMTILLRQVQLEAEKQMFSGGAAGAIESEFDALQMDRFTKLQELSRRVAEAMNDVLTQQNATLSAVRDMEEVLATQHILLSDLSGEINQIRQVRVSSIVPNLKRTVRTACRETGKQGEIYFDADVEIDRGILDKIQGPIEHILRNAIAHGIESTNDRHAAGKQEVGTIEFRAYQDGGEVVIEIKDDGAGINAHKVLQRAVERNLVKPGMRLNEEKVFELLFEPGFSTADTVSELAGRGVGLDVVRSQISGMGGRVEISSTMGHGTTFMLRMPATLTVIAGTAVTANNHMYVVPVSFIDRLVRISSKDLDDAYKSQRLIVKDSSGETIEYEFVGLWQLMNMPAMEARPATRNSVILMRGSRIAVHVDDIRPASEYVFRPMGPQLTASSGLIGSTINESGNASLVVDPARVNRNLKLANAAKGIDMRLGKKTIKTPLVLIVDDSLTVRKVTARLLKNEGLRHMEAENGMHALERMQEERPDVILMDIEMPVMNGYDATQAIRATAGIKDIPIIMITSRVGEMHRQRAFELGVNEYLGKPYNDVDLMGLIKKYASVESESN